MVQCIERTNLSGKGSVAATVKWAKVTGLRPLKEVVVHFMEHIYCKNSVSAKQVCKTSSELFVLHCACLPVRRRSKKKVVAKTASYQSN